MKNLSVNISFPIEIMAKVEIYCQRENIHTSQGIVQLVCRAMGVDSSKLTFRKQKNTNKNTRIFYDLTKNVISKPLPTCSYDLITDPCLTRASYDIVEYNVSSLKQWPTVGDKKGYDYSDIPEDQREAAIKNHLKMIADFRKKFEFVD